MKRRCRIVVPCLLLSGAACFVDLPSLSAVVTTAVNIVVMGRAATGDSRLAQSFDVSVKGLEGKVANKAERLELIERARAEMQGEINQLKGHVEDGLTKVEDRLTKVEDGLTKVEDHLTKVEDGIEEVKKLLSKPDDPFNFFRR